MHAPPVVRRVMCAAAAPARPAPSRGLPMPSGVAALLAIALAVCALTGWVFDLPLLARFVPGRPALTPMTATLLTAGALAALAVPRHSALARTLAVALALSGLAIAIGHALQLPARSGLRPDWWTSPLTALSLGLLGGAAWLLGAARWAAGQFAALAVFLFAALVGLGHVFPQADLYRAMPGTGVAIPTVLGLLALSSSLLLVAPRQGVVGALTSDRIVGRVGRRLLVIGTAGMPLLAVLVLVARALAGFDAETAVLLMAWGAMAAAGAMLWGLAVAADRADQARALAERERDEMRQLVAAALTHDLRTPLQTATALATVLQRLATAPQAVSAVERLQRSHRRLDRLVRSLLDALALEAGRALRLTPAPVALHELVADVLAENEAALSDRLVLEGRAQGWWDRDALFRVIENLVLNAAKYGARASPIWCRLRETPDGQVELTVENQGRPIAEADRTSIFQPFTRGSEPGRRQPIGWGIGLAFARAVARGHGGDIRLLRSDQEATVFGLHLPRDARPWLEPPAPPAGGH